MKTKPETYGLDMVPEVAVGHDATCTGAHCDFPATEEAMMNFKNQVLYDEAGVVVEPVKRAIVHCPLCEREFPGPNGAQDFVNHRCEG